MSTSLPRGLLCDRGYLFIRVFRDKNPKPFLQGCGPHTLQNQKVATLQLNRYRDQMFLGQFNMTKPAESITFSGAVEMYVKHKEFKTAGSAAIAAGILRNHGAPFFGHVSFDKVTPAMAANWRESATKKTVMGGAPVSFSSVNRWQGTLHSLYSNLMAWAKLEKPFMAGIQLPTENPFKYVEKPSEKDLSRQRVPSREEIIRAREWCASHDTELWEAICRATATFLRKSDFVKNMASGAGSGTQNKTGKRFNVYVKFPNPISLSNWRKRWDALRTYMLWKAEGTEFHTVWHDLRHLGPTILAEHGYSSKQIQKLTGHSAEAMADRYTHLRKEKMEEAVNLVSKEIRG